MKLAATVSAASASVGSSTAAAAAVVAAVVASSAPKTPRSAHKEKKGDDSDDSGDEADQHHMTTFKKPPPPPVPPPPSAIPVETPLSPRNDVIRIKVDVLKFLKRGAPFLKYGKHGFPHFRLFQVSPQHDALIWYSKSKKIAETQISFRDMDELVYGQTTAVFERHKAPELSKSSFSILYDKGRKTLDLIAKDPNEFTMWTEGLIQLIDLAKSKSFSYMAELQNLEVELPVKRGRRSSMALIMAAGIQPTAADNPLNNQSNTDGKVTDGEAQGIIGNLKKRYTKFYEKLHSKRYTGSPQYENMKQVLEGVKESIERIDVWYTEGNYNACDDEAWRAGVDLEALENMLAILVE